MKQTINFSQFLDAFQSAGRGNQFSYEALRVLFDHLEQYEEDCGQEIELDVIALCCEFNELDIEDFKDQYRDLNIEEDQDEKEAITDFLSERSICCGWTSANTVVFQQF